MNLSNDIQKSEELFRSTFDSLMEGCQIIGFDWTYLYVNNAALVHSHLSREEILGKKYMDVWHGINQTEVFQILQHCMEERVAHHFESDNVFPNCSKNWFDLSIQPVPEGIFILSREITEMKSAEETLKESEEKFSKAFQTSPYAITITRAEDGKFIEINDTFCTIIGYTQEEALTNSSIGLKLWVKESDRQEVINILHSGCEVKNKEYLFRKKDGKIINTLFSALMIKLNIGNCILSSINDITEQRKAEEALRESERKLSEAKQLAQLGYWSWDIQTGDVAWSDEVYQIFRLDSREFKPQIDSIMSLSPWAEDHERDQELIKKAMESHEKGSYEQKFLRPDESIGYYQSTFQGIYDSDDNLISIIGTVFDITERKKAEILLFDHMKNYTVELEEQVAKRTAELEVANRELEDFASSIAHYLQTPLRAVDGFTHILQEDYKSILDTEGKHLCSIITESTKDMSKLIDNLLTFSRIGRIPMQISKINMEVIVQFIAREIISPGNPGRMDFEVSKLPIVTGDEKLIRQVWFHLLSNAVKYSSKKEQAIIEVNAAEQENEIIFSVKDNGAGFDQLYMDKLFRIFQRLHSTQEFEGTGVGLAIVQRIILRHGGKVWAKGDIDEGATFYFSLPK